MVTYNILDVNQFVAHIPQRTTFKITQAGFFYHDIRHLPKNKDAHIVVNDSCFPVPQVKDKKKGYTARDIKISDRARQLQHISGQ